MHGTSLVTLVAGIAIGVSVVAGGAMAMQDKPMLPEIPKAPDMPKVPAMPKAPDVPAMPEMDAEMKRMMEAWMKAGMVGKEHERLTKTVGTWKGVTTTRMGPEESTTEMTTVITSLMGGRFVRGESTGTMDMGMGPVAFEGLGHYGFNNTTQKYECTWMDNSGTMMMFMNGVASEDGKVISWKGEFIDPGTGGKTWMKIVDTLVNDDAITLEFYSPSPDGGEANMMTINYTRVGGVKGGR